MVRSTSRSTNSTKCCAALAAHDTSLAGLVIADDDRIDRRYLETHQAILSLLARQTPVAGDLRLVAAIAAPDLAVERIGDQCVDIGEPVAFGVTGLLHEFSASSGGRFAPACRPRRWRK